jgi:hypothetical protein
LPGPAVVAHDVNCDRARRTPLGGHSDAAKRVSDTYRLHRLAAGHAAIGQWFAAALADGTTDTVLYESKQAAVRHQHHNEVYFAFVCIGPHDMNVCEAEEFLALNRMLYDKGIRLTDPDHVKGGREIVQRATVEDQRSLVASIANGGRSRPSNLIYPDDRRGR